MTPSEKIRAIQALLEQYRIDACIIRNADPHQSEYVAARWQSRAWVSGFTGSAGTLVITRRWAGLWADPRYHIRAATELADSGIELFKEGLPGVSSPAARLADQLGNGAVIGFNGAVFSVAEIEELAQAFRGKQVTFLFEHDFVGEIWADRPAAPPNPIFLHDVKFAGETRRAKLHRIRREMCEQNAQVYFISALDDIAWVLNFRGSDVDYNPVAVCYLLISRDELLLFMDASKIPTDVRAELEDDSVQIVPYDQVFTYLQQLPADTVVLIDPEKTSYKAAQVLSQGCTPLHHSGIISYLKGIKNSVEQEGMRQAHIVDGVAFVRWLYWLDHQAFEDDAHTEITLAEKLNDFRCAGAYFKGPSFNTIGGYGANSAVGHYCARPQTTPAIKPTGIFLVDSGGQYLNGTTDVTRTLSLGNPTGEQKRAFTTVLRSLIRLSRAKFPRGTPGNNLDALTREPLWQQGWECRHGIGHGVSCFLNVHEGPHRINKTNTVIFEPGMITSNEPGIYFEGRFGIRLENVLLTISETSTEFGEFLGFETLTLCPIDLNLVERALLCDEEIIWLNQYHQRVFKTLSPFLTLPQAEWLSEVTRAI